LLVELGRTRVGGPEPLGFLGHDAGKSGAIDGDGGFGWHRSMMRHDRGGRRPIPSGATEARI
jgi:hypothetical protein